MSSSVERLARRLIRQERGIFAAQTAPRLPYSSIDGGALEIRDPEGNVAGFIGQQYDGTTTTAMVGGTWPSIPSAPLVTPTLGGLRIFWDGTYEDNSLTRMDFKRVTFHATTDSTLEDLDPLSPAQIVGEVTIATGGEIYCDLPPVEHFVVAVVWTDAGKFSEPSIPGFATPIEGSSAEQWQEHEDALETLHTVTLPALQSDLSDNSDALDTLQTTTLPGLEGRLTSTEDDVDTLQTTTLPALQAELDASQVDITNATGRITSVENAVGTLEDTTLPALDAELEQAKIDLALADAKLASKGTDLVVNGTGIMGDATNFNDYFTVNKVDVPTGSAASFYAKLTYSHGAMIDEFIGYDPSKKYRLSFKVRQTVPGATNHLYGFVAPYDQWGNSIQPTNYMFIANTTTTLAAPLNPGDTTITLTDASDWYGSAAKPAGSSTHFRRLIFWDWIDPNGKVWPEHTYSRDLTSSNTWADGALVGNVITLPAPWAGAAKPAGAKVSNGSSAGSYIYMPSVTNVDVPESWTAFSDVHNGGIMADVTDATGRGGATWGSGMPPGTAQIKIGWLLNYAPIPANPTVGRHAIASVSFSDASAAQAIADTSAARIVDWTTLGQTTINGGKITTDSVTSNQIAADAITANELAANAVTAAKIVSRTITALQIAADTITANEIAADTITANEIAADTITASEIAADTITASEIAADTITANEIAADAITASEIAAEAVTTAKLDAEAVTAAKIAVGAIVAEKIAAGAISTEHLSASSVTADILDAEVLRAGFTLTGRLQVGESYITPEEGLVIPQPDGSTTRFPADGVTAAQISGHLKAKSATIEKDFNLNGTTNQVAGTLKLANGITPPTSAPSLYPSWDTRYSSTLNNNANYNVQVFRGAASAPNSSHFAVGINFFGAGIRFVNKSTGDWAGDPISGKSWTSGFYPRGGMGFANSHYFFYGHDSNRSDGWYIYKVNANYDKVDELYVGPYSAHNANMMSLTASTATGGVYLAFCNNSNEIILRTWDTNLGFLSDTTLYTASAGRNIDALYVGAADYGTNKVLVAEREAGVVYGWTLSGFVRDTTIDFPMGHGAKIQGLHYDSTLGKLISFDQDGRIVHYSSAKNARTVTGSYTWYDGDGTVRETTPSPSQSVVFGARTLVSVETPPAPDSGVTDPTRVDKANRIGIYLGTGAAARRRQIYLGVDGSGVSIRKHTADVITTNLNVEPVTNTFGGANVPPGSLASQAVDGLGAPKLELLGDGSAKVDTLNVTAWKSVDVPWTNLTNTLAVGAVQYAVRAGWVSVRINATAATASGTTYTTVTSGIPSVLRPSKNTRGACDFSGFPGSIVVTPSGSILFAHNSGANRAAIEGFVTWPIE